MGQLQRFYRHEHEWHTIAQQLKLTPCPHCQKVGTLNRHGKLYGCDECHPSNKTVRGRRLFCSNRNKHRRGCGRTFSVWQADKIHRLSLTAGALWQFLLRVAAGTVIAASHADSRRSDRTWQRLWKRFNLGQSPIRIALDKRCQPPQLPTSHRPADQTIAHLQAAFPQANCPITAFQHTLQTFFV